MSILDYDEYFKEHLHKFARFAKGQWTQHQFFFDHTNDERYPNHVKMTYRKYSQEVAIEIVKDPHHDTGMVSI